jgi:hypothetical protein
MSRIAQTMALSFIAPALLIGQAAAQQPVPGNVQANATSPTNVNLTWTAPAGANGYVVQRAIGSNSLTRLTPDKITAIAYTDAAAPAGSALRYRVKALFPSGATSLSTIVSVTTPGAPSNTASGTGQTGPPPGQPTSDPVVTTSPGAQATVAAGATRERTYTGLVPKSPGTLTAVAPAAASSPALATPTAADPSGFTANLQGSKVTLSWQAVPGINWYLLGGPGMAPNGQQVQGASYTFDSPGPGQHEWTVASLAGQGQGPLNNWVGWPKAQLSIAPEVVHSGRYRVTMIGFHVDEESTDDWWSWDGKGDEVYLAAYFGLKDRRTSDVSMRGHVQSVIYGDVNNLPGRIQAGSGSALGGLRTGDAYPDNAGATLPAAGPEGDRVPLMVWEGPLTDGADELLVAPSIWESDRQVAPFIRWWQKLDQIIPDVFNDEAVKGDLTTPNPHPVVARELDLAFVGAGADRPFGVRPAGATPWMRQQAVVLTREKIESALSSPYRVGGVAPGVIPVTFTDWRDDRIGTGGSYTAYLRVERLP